jgi:uncharacterized surface protein with fasciclin (FAS1) repeats/nucleoid-associated protein YgaU
MTQSKWRLFFTAALLTALLVTALAPAAFAAEQSAPAYQVRATEVTGTIPGGQFAKFWLGIVPDRPGTVTVSATWDRSNPEDTGVGFYVLNEAGLSAVVNGQRIEANNVATGDTQFFLNGPDNVQGAAFRATGDAYTLVVYNDSAGDANFTLRAENAMIVDESDQVKAVGAAAEEEMADAEATEAAAEAPAAAIEAATEAAEAAATPAAETVAEATTTTTVVAAGPFRGSSVRGELSEQYEQHYLGMEPEQRDSEITLRLTFDPRDNQELARRMNFWVLDEAGLRRYQGGESASDLAVANGNRVTTPGDENVRSASFSAPGLGSYTVIVYNNSRVPATYELVATGAVLVDDALQTISAQEAATTTTTVVAPAATTGTGATTTATTTTTTTTTAADTTAGTGREGEPGGAYTVQSGDTLALIARDIYGDFTLYEQLCSFNNIADCNIIEVGQVINLPTREQIGAGAAAPATATPATAATTAATPAAVTTTTATTGTAATTATTSVTTTTTTTATTPVTSTGATTSTTPSTGAATSTIAEIAASNPNFSILASALEATGLDATLGSGEFTVFAPTDAAFNTLLEQTGLTAAQLLQAPELAQILQYHVVSGAVGSADITNGMRATTVQGQPVTFELRDGSVYINGSKVTIADIQASNGVIHAISAVILPPAQ